MIATDQVRTPISKHQLLYFPQKSNDTSVAVRELVSAQMSPHQPHLLSQPGLNHRHLAVSKGPISVCECVIV